MGVLFHPCLSAGWRVLSATRQPAAAVRLCAMFVRCLGGMRFWRIDEPRGSGAAIKYLGSAHPTYPRRGRKVLCRNGTGSLNGELATYRTVLVSGEHGAADPTSPCHGIR